MSDTDSQCQRITGYADGDTITLAELKQFVGWAGDKGFPDDSPITTSAGTAVPAGARAIRVERPPASPVAAGVSREAAS